MPIFRRMMMRRMGPLGVALTLYDVWRRIPPKQRQRLVSGARTHGPKLASRAAQARRARRGR